MTSHMAREIAEIPDACARLLSDRLAPDFAAAVDAFDAATPTGLVTIGRGSSDHAATYLAYAFGIVADLIPSSYPLSLASLHGHCPAARGQVVLAISQSGRSPDLVAAATALRAGGAPVAVVTNSADSPLAQVGDVVLDIRAGPERAVAATKSFVASLMAGLRLLAAWRSDVALLGALERAPDALASALDAPVLDLTEILACSDRLMVLGRGPALGIAQEVALKAMELCQITAVGLSSAEVRHGPMQVLTDGYPVLDLQRADPLPGARTLSPPTRPTLHPLVDPMLDLAPIYMALEAAARAKGFDPDAPARLQKETVTI